MGHLLSHDHWPALNLAGELRYSYVGGQRFLTGDTSKNSFWVAMLTFGEGWHNNHHAHPQAARHGLAWYEFDFNWYGISALRMLHLAWDVKTWKRRPDEDKAVTVARSLAARSQEGRCLPGVAEDLDKNRASALLTRGETYITLKHPNPESSM
jgi:hypothetical protein